MKYSVKLVGNKEKGVPTSWFAKNNNVVNKQKDSVFNDYEDAHYAARRASIQDDLNRSAVVVEMW
jgi:hypothetical protein